MPIEKFWTEGIWVYKEHGSKRSGVYPIEKRWTLNNIGWNFSNSYESLPKRFYVRGRRSKFPEPELVIYNEKLAKELGIQEILDQMKDYEKAELLCGNVMPEGASIINQAYAAHQYAHFTMLGDGRAVLIGEQITPEGKRFDIQLKGNGRSVFSRGGDGRAVLGPMLREYLISEAMDSLGIPSTRSLAVVKTGEDVRRERILPGAVLTRVSSSHIRVGTFQFAAMGEDSDIRQLADYTIGRHYPEISDMAKEGPECYRLLLRHIVHRQARLIARWQLVGFIHGVMNTDNMAISGETIDYGPCAFMDRYDPQTVFSSIDKYGRYRYENQPSIGQWNLARLADALLPILDEGPERAMEIATEEIKGYVSEYQKAWLDGMRQKLGLLGEDPQDGELFDDLLDQMQEKAADYTNTFVRLTLESEGEDGSYLEGTQLLFADEGFSKWKMRWNDRRTKQGEQEESCRLMKAANPFVIPRNFRVEDALEAVLQDDMSVFLELLEVLQQPYRYDEAHRKYQELPKRSMEGYRTFCGT